MSDNIKKIVIAPPSRNGSPRISPRVLSSKNEEPAEPLDLNDLVKHIHIIVKL